jgi:erythromycin esterase-like protein
MNTLPQLIRDAAKPLTGSPRDYAPLLDLVGDARFVLLGEATHGTHEFYRERAQITKRLIREKGFHAIAVEADWPDAYHINRFVHGADDNTDAADALDGFKRFPQWMWRNADVLDFTRWLRHHNRLQKAEERKVGFYGLDLYSLHASIEAVLAYLAKVDPASVPRARKRYACFDHFGQDTQTYGLATGLGMAPSCEEAVINELVELRLREAQYLQHDGRVAEDELFCAEQNALVIKNAEQYYRTMFRGEVSSWNLRDHHMMETLAALSSHLEQFQKPAKMVVWAHNSHLGDARATEMSKRGEFNLGQLVRERFGKQSIHVGLTTYTGTVTAASDWDGAAERKSIRPALADSYEDLFHRAEHSRFWLEFKKHEELALELKGARLERAIGVIYRPETERASHYFTARLPEQFDAVLHFDETRAVEPLERSPKSKLGEVEETFPSGI